MKHYRNIALLPIMALFPSIALAGGYGSAGVSDATVGATAAAGETLYCRRIQAEVPRRLYQDMNCGDAGTGFAAPQVAPERFTNDDRRGPFGLPAHVSSGPTINDKDSEPPKVVTDKSTPQPDKSENPDEPDKDVPDTTSAPIAKWERLEQLGVNSDNFESQSPEFKQQFSDYFDQVGGEGDWSGFGG